MLTDLFFYYYLLIPCLEYLVNNFVIFKSGPDKKIKKYYYY